MNRLRALYKSAIPLLVFAFAAGIALIVPPREPFTFGMRMMCVAVAMCPQTHTIDMSCKNCCGVSLPCLITACGEGFSLPATLHGTIVADCPGIDGMQFELHFDEDDGCWKADQNPCQDGGDFAPYLTLICEGGTPKVIWGAPFFGTRPDDCSGGGLAVDSFNCAPFSVTTSTGSGGNGVCACANGNIVITITE